MAKQKQTSGLSAEKKEFVKLLESISYHTSDRDKFYDFCEMTALTMQLPFGAISEDNLKALQRLHKKYNRTQIEMFDKMLVVMMESLEESYHDFLGTIFMSLEMGSNYKGQFFTPWPVCSMMAKMTLPTNLKAYVKAQGGHFTVNEPTAGAGGMVIALADEVIKAGLNHSTSMYVLAQDIDLLACYMTYIQLSLCGVAATVRHGNTLTLETWGEWKTPVYYLNRWPMRIALKKTLQFLRDRTETPIIPEQTDIIPDQAEIIPQPEKPKGQMSFDFDLEPQQIKEAV